jgi:hypothetical protein
MTEVRVRYDELKEPCQSDYRCNLQSAKEARERVLVQLAVCKRGAKTNAHRNDNITFNYITYVINRLGDV